MEIACTRLPPHQRGGKNQAMRTRPNGKGASIFYPDVSQIWVDIAQDIGFTRKFPKERRIGDYGRLREYSLWNQETSEIDVNL